MKLKLLNFRSIIVASLLFLTFIIPFMAMQNFSPASDEISHLPSGYSYLKTGEIKLNPQHPPLIKMLAAFPLLFMDIKFDSSDPNLIGAQAKEWQFGSNFFARNGVDRMMFWGRIPMVLLSVLLGWYVFRWGKDLFNYEAGIIGLAIYALMPNIIAHSQLVTTDLGVTAFSFIALYYLWKFTSESANKNLLLAGLNLGLALGSKFSAVFLLPIFLVLIAVYIYKEYKNLNWLNKINLLLKLSLPIYGLAFLVIWALYFFPSDPLFYREGLKTVYADSNTVYKYYLNGDFSRGGWWYYFLWAFVIKTPIAFLVALLVSFFFYKKSSLNFLDSLFIFLPATLFLAITSWKAHNIGVRYVLVVYPFLILFVSGWISTIIKNAKIKMQNDNLNFKILNPVHKFYIFNFTFLILFGWYLWSSLRAYPDYLPYFNEIVGGSDNGYKHMDDSNIEWGHDLKRLVEYQKKYPDLKVAYIWDTFVNASKLYDVKNLLSLSLKENWWRNPNGRYAINVHALIRAKLASSVYEDERLNWIDRYESVDRIGQSFFIYEFP